MALAVNVIPDCTDKLHSDGPRLVFAYAERVAEGSERGGLAGSQGMQRAVGEHHVGRPPLLVGNALAQLAQPVEEFGILRLSARHGQQRLRLLLPLSARLHAVVLAANGCQPHLAAPVEHVVAEGGHAQVAVLVVGNLHKPHLKHLQQIVVPVACRHVEASAERLQPLEAVRHHLRRRHAAQQVDEHREAHALLRAHNCREGFLHERRAVERLRRRVAHVAVAAVLLADFAEVVQQDAAPAHLRLGILLHAQQFVEVDVALPALVGKASQCDDVLQVIEKDGLAGQSVAAAAPYLLIETLYALRQVVVHDEAHVALVDAHAEGYRGTNHLYSVGHEIVLHAVALGSRQTGMIDPHRHAGALQFLGQRLGSLACQAVDDAALVGMAAYEGMDGAQFLGSRVAALHVEAQVGAVERTDERACLLQVQLLQDVALRQFVGRCRERHDGHAGKQFAQLPQLRVFGSEVVAPVRDAVGLVDGEERDARLLQRAHHAAYESFGRNVEQFHLAFHAAVDDEAVVSLVVVAVHCFCLYSVGLQRAHLVFHQRDEGRHDDRHSLPEQGGYLEAQRLATARGHQHQRIAAANGVADDFLLHRAERIVAVVGFQCV